MGFWGLIQNKRKQRTFHLFWNHVRAQGMVRGVAYGTRDAFVRPSPGYDLDVAAPSPVLARVGPGRKAMLKTVLVGRLCKHPARLRLQLQGLRRQFVETLAMAQGPCRDLKFTDTCATRFRCRGGTAGEFRPHTCLNSSMPVVKRQRPCHAATKVSLPCFILEERSLR